MKIVKLLVIHYLFILGFFSSLIKANEQTMINKWIPNYILNIKNNDNDIYDESPLTDRILNFIIEINQNKFYFNEQLYLIQIITTDIETFFRQNNLAQFNFSAEKMISQLNSYYGIELKDKITYIQFDKSITHTALSPFLTLNNQAILIGDKLFLLKDGYLFSYLAPYFEKEFIKETKNLKEINFSINTSIYFDFPSFTSIPAHFKTFLTLPQDVREIKAAKLSSLLPNIHPIFISNYLESGDVELYLYIFSNDYKLRDKLFIYSDESPIRSSLACNRYMAGRNFYINKDYLIDIQHRYEDESMKISQYQITKDGYIKQKPITSSCYLKEKGNSDTSVMLTAYQANNYLRPYYGTNLSELADSHLTLTLNTKNNQLCINYYQPYSASFGKQNSRKFFGNEAFYQQQVANFKRHGIDISQELTYVKFEQIQQSPLAAFLLNGDKAIYMKETFFLVGQDYFMAFRQPTDKELFYTGDSCD
ncbi:MAG: hypothetical protein J6562_02995 [Candidatus Schmidhempelia sp.]|nr:hypothetical protein [Candidatus Schmidhempelia sp.]